MTSPKTVIVQCNANAREMSVRVLAFLRRQDEPYSTSQLVDQLCSSKTVVQAAIALLIGTESVRTETIKGVKHYLASTSGMRTPAKLTMNMTSTYKPPKELMDRFREAKNDRLEFPSKFEK